jgi:hypothetical protein
MHFVSAQHPRAVFYTAAMVTRRTKPETHRTTRRAPASVKRQPAAKTSAIPRRRKGEDVFAYIIRLGDSIPKAELVDIPTDLARNLDHYLYGAPKED